MKKLSIFIFVLSLLFGVVLQSAVIAVTGQYYSGGSYELTIYSNNQFAGTTSPSPGVVYVDYGLSYQVTAQPNPGYIFNGWYLNGIYQHKMHTITVTMLHDNVLMASFTQEGVSLNITTYPSHEGTTNPPPGILFFQYGTPVTVTAYPANDSVFSGWYLDGEFMGTETSITVPMNASRDLEAYFVGSSSTPPDDPLPQSNLTLSCKSHTTYSDFSVEIGGTLETDQGEPIPSAGIVFELSVNGGSSWETLSFVNTDLNGEFSVSWKPSVTGYFLLKALWIGNPSYIGTDVVVNFAVTPFEQQSVFSVTSNSTLTGLAFDSNSSEFHFNVEGPSGTTGYTNVIIPKSLVEDSSTIRVYVDEDEMTRECVSQGDAWSLTFTYSHSTHQVVVDLDAEPLTASDVPLTDSPLVLVLIVAAIVAAAVIITIIVMKKTQK